jgi:hypothetical protein
MNDELLGIILVIALVASIWLGLEFMAYRNCAGNYDLIRGCGQYDRNGNWSQI